ncbi:hypothetical protein BuS5_02655 [Desulfosarcina sp. BuS5]|uniref:hypothetical protein n=1 Tax=Desulfosarcina sp. BuS5 TaxID=933262 RepID=UPI0004874772|nr:hypothetical protein [Desulfosarcina sp. BuS5]WDN89687.1 hypothetical protein BuS5_02655 [Desulfosarcina sp. BuS5]
MAILVTTATQAIFPSGTALAGEDVQTLGTIVVTAEKLSDYIKNHPQQVVMLDQKEIEEQNFLEVAEAITSMHGVEVRRHYYE